jgi:hypothetical protein
MRLGSSSIGSFTIVGLISDDMIGRCQEKGYGRSLKLLRGTFSTGECRASILRFKRPTLWSQRSMLNPKIASFGPFCTLASLTPRFSFCESASGFFCCPCSRHHEPRRCFLMIPIWIHNIAHSHSAISQRRVPALPLAQRRPPVQHETVHPRLVKASLTRLVSTPSYHLSQCPVRLIVLFHRINSDTVLVQDETFSYV